MGSPGRGEDGAQYRGSLSPPALTPLLGVPERKGKEKRERIIACLSLFYYLFMWEGGNLGHHFVSGLKYFLFHKQKAFWRRMLSRTEK